MAQDDQFLVVELHDVGPLRRGLDDFERVELLAQVDVEDLQAAVVRGHGIEEAQDGGGRYVAALRE